MKSRTIECVAAPPGEESSLLTIGAMAKPQTAGHAEMLEGGPDEVAAKVVDMLSARGLV